MQEVITKSTKGDENGQEDSLALFVSFVVQQIFLGKACAVSYTTSVVNIYPLAGCETATDWVCLAMAG